MKHRGTEGDESPNNFRFRGSGLENELPAFVEHLKTINPSMANVFSKYVSFLKDASTDDARRAARESFNASAKSDVLAGLADPVEGEK